MRMPADDHVHSEWSFDARRGDMERTCERAIRIGLPSVAFTEHVDFTAWGPGDGDGGPAEQLTIDRRRVRPFDIEGYFACLERCRDLFPGLRIRSGIEAGEPHLFAASLDKVLGQASFDRVLGSLHSISLDGALVFAENAVGPVDADEVLRRYFDEMLRLIEASDSFEVLAHVDYPRRAWPTQQGAPAFDELDFEAEYRAVFRALAGSGRVLEVNTKGPLLTIQLLRWWREEGGGAVSFGSDTHRPERVGQRFGEATAIASAAGFRPTDDPLDFWRR